MNIYNILRIHPKAGKDAELTTVLGSGRPIRTDGCALGNSIISNQSTHDLLGSQTSHPSGGVPNTSTDRGRPSPKTSLLSLGDQVIHFRSSI